MAPYSLLSDVASRGTCWVSTQYRTQWRQPAVSAAKYMYFGRSASATRLLTTSWTTSHGDSGAAAARPGWPLGCGGGALHPAGPSPGAGVGADDDDGWRPGAAADGDDEEAAAPSTEQSSEDETDIGRSASARAGRARRSASARARCSATRSASARAGRAVVEATKELRPPHEVPPGCRRRGPPSPSLAGAAGFAPCASSALPARHL
jgi:hypothetical protein